jgi:hypothetical protein
MVRGEADLFQGGLPGFAGTLDEMLVVLRNLIRETSADRCVTIGERAGGYASLLLGALIGEVDFVAFSPVLRASRYLRGRDGPQGHPFWGDLPEALRDHPPRHNGLQFHSPWTLEGVSALLAVSEAGPALGCAVEVSCMGPVHQHIAREYKGYNPLMSPVQQLSDLRVGKVVAPIFSDGSSADYALFQEVGDALASKSKDFDLARSARRRRDWDNPGWQKTRGLALRASDERKDAIAALQHGHHLVPRDIPLAFELGRCASEAGEDAIARKMLDLILALEAEQTRKSSFGDRLRGIVKP